jgi:hypothetical protein
MGLIATMHIIEGNIMETSNKTLDFYGNPLYVGNEVLYIGTHTYGRVEKISVTNGVNWVKIDTTGLYYRSEYLELTKLKKSALEKRITKKKQIIQKLSRSKQINQTQEPKISDHPDGPGYGGG